jgi:hypothetical protein
LFGLGVFWCETSAVGDGTSLAGFTLWLMMMMMMMFLSVLGSTLHTQVVLPYHRDLQCNISTFKAPVVKMNVPYEITNQ